MRINKDVFGSGGANLTPSGAGEPPLAEVLDVVTREVGDPAYAVMENWFIDPVSGDDKHDGDSVNGALKTLDELSRRLRDQEINQTTIIQLLGDVPATDRPVLRLNIGDNGFVVIRGTKTPLAIGTLTAVTNKNPAANQPYEITDSALADDFGPLGLVGKQIRLTGGAQEGATAWIAKDLTGKKARVSFWSIEPLAVQGMNLWSTPTNAPVDSPYVVEQMSSVDDLLLDVCISTEWVASSCKLVIEDLTINPGDDRVTRFRSTGSYYGVAFKNCSLGNLVPVGSPLRTLGCKHSFAGFYQAGTYELNYALVTWTCDVYAGSAMLLRGCFLQDAGIYTFGQGHIYVSGDLGIMDCPYDAVYLSSGGGVVRLGSLWGSGNADFGCNVLAGSALYYTSVPTITGVSGDAKIGGTARTWAQIPYIEPANNAAIVAYA